MNNQSDYNMEYPVIECKEAVLSFWTIVFPTIIAIIFGVFGILIPIVIISNDGFSPNILFLCIFTIVSVIAYYIVIVNIFKYVILHIKGKEVEATVYGYMNDNVLVDGQPTQILKLLITTEEGPKFILYQLGDINRPYKLNRKLKVLVYKDLFCIEREKKDY